MRNMLNFIIIILLFPIGIMVIRECHKEMVKPVISDEWRSIKSDDIESVSIVPFLDKASKCGLTVKHDASIQDKEVIFQIWHEMLGKHSFSKFTPTNSHWSTEKQLRLIFRLVSGKKYILG